MTRPRNTTSVFVRNAEQSSRPPRLRRAAVGLVASVALLGVGTLPAAAASHGWTSAAVGLADWSTGQYGSGDWGESGGDWGGWGGSGGSGSTETTVDSQAATAAQSKGVVLIDTVLQYQGAEAAGTGVIITSAGQVLTNYHVVEGATSISVTVASTGKTYTATVVGHDESHDVALLQLKDASGLDTVKVDDDTVAVGDDVTAVGNAGGTGSLTAADGTVSSLTATVTTAAEGSVASETLKSMIETDADVVAGDSGGPLFDAEGEVIGIDTAASSGSEIDGYAIPIEEALQIVDQIRSGSETSTVQVGPAAFLGVMVSDDSASAGGQDSMGEYGTSQDGTGGYGDSQHDAATGATVSGVVDGGPAAAAGLEAGDVITGIGSHRITSASEVSSLLATYGVGEKVKITWNDSSGASQTSTVTLAASPVA